MDRDCCPPGRCNSPIACLIGAGRLDPGFAETGEPTPGGPFRPIEDELPIRERYEEPEDQPIRYGENVTAARLGRDIDRAFGFPVKPPTEPGVIDVTEGRRPAAIEVGEYEPEGPYRPFKGRGGES